MISRKKRSKQSKIIRVHFPEIERELMDSAVDTFYRLRELEGIEKRPATRELINWVRALGADPDFKPRRLAKGEIPFLGVLFKKSQDYQKAGAMVNRRKLF